MKFYLGESQNVESDSLICESDFYYDQQSQMIIIE